MTRRSVQISVPTPCHESWDQMDATARGSFCQRCRKEVIDFSAMTEREVVEYLQRQQAGCGRLRRDQIDTVLSIAEVDNGVFRWKALMLGLLPIFAFNTAKGASIPAVSVEHVVTSEKKAQPSDADNTRTVHITGHVFSDIGGAVAGADVFIEHSTGRQPGILVTTDSTGHFSLSFACTRFDSKSYVIVVSAINHLRKTVAFTTDPTQDYPVTLTFRREDYCYEPALRYTPAPTATLYTGLATKITGRVTDTKGAGLPFASVVTADRQGRSTGIGTVCDENGGFTLDYSFPDTSLRLSVHSIGYESTSLWISKKEAQNNVIKLIEMTEHVMGDIIIARPSAAHRIRNWFRYSFSFFRPD